MRLCLEKKSRQKNNAGFTLIETLVAFLIFAMVAGGVIYGYVQTNRMAEWSALSLAAQSYASQGAEQARAAKWEPYAYPQNTNTDQMPSGSIVSHVGIFDIPIKGTPTAADFMMWETNVVTVTNVMSNPWLRQIPSRVVWTFYLTGRKYTNTYVLLRAPDQ